MDKMIAYCGLVCTECPAYIAKQKDDNELREKTAKEWATAFNPDIKTEMINCDGCKNNGRKFFYCENLCEIRKCCMDKNIENCAICDEYMCNILSSFIKIAPQAGEALEKLRSEKKG